MYFTENVKHMFLELNRQSSNVLKHMHPCNGKADEIRKGRRDQCEPSGIEISIATFCGVNTEMVMYTCRQASRSLKPPPHAQPDLWSQIMHGTAWNHGTTTKE